MNSTADLIEVQVGVPVLHIADATGAAIKKSMWTSSSVSRARKGPRV